MPNPWQRYAARTIKLEQVFQPKIVRIIKKVRREFIQNLQAYGQSAARNELSKIVLDKDLTQMIQAIYKTAGVLGARMLREEQARYLKQVEKKAAGFGRNERWIQAVVQYLRVHMLEFVSGITDTMREDILKALEKAIEEGWGIAETVRYLQRSDLVEARAKVIARTEINRAANVGHAEAAKELPYEVDKKWSAARDHRTRQSHIIINGHTTDENGYFRVPIFSGKKQIGWDEMQFPGDPNAHVSNNANCRCRVIYIPKRDSAGRLVMRDRTQAPVITMRRPSQYLPEQIAAQLKSHITIGVK